MHHEPGFAFHGRFRQGGGERDQVAHRHDAAAAALQRGGMREPSGGARSAAQCRVQRRQRPWSLHGSRDVDGRPRGGGRPASLHHRQWNVLAVVHHQAAGGPHLVPWRVEDVHLPRVLGVEAVHRCGGAEAHRDPRPGPDVERAQPGGQIRVWPAVHAVPDTLQLTGSQFEHEFAIAHEIQQLAGGRHAVLGYQQSVELFVHAGDRGLAGGVRAVSAEAGCG